MKTGLLAVGFTGLCLLIGWGAATDRGWLALVAVLVLAFAVGFIAERKLG